MSRSNNRWGRERKYGNTPVYECETPSCDMFYEGPRPRFCVKCQSEEFIYHASTGEFRRWRELQLLQSQKLIKNLKRQVRYPVKINGVKVFTYVADFDYMEGSKHVVEDYKGVSTREFKIKRKGFEAYYGIPLTISRAR